MSNDGGHDVMKIETQEYLEVIANRQATWRLGACWR